MRKRASMNAAAAILAVALLLAVASAQAAQAPLAGGKLADAMASTGLKYLMQDDTTAVLLLKGKAGVHVVTVRLLDQVLAVFAEIAVAREDRVSLPLWKKVAEVNARPALAHVGYSKARGKFYSISGLSDPRQATGPLLKAMVVDVASLADEQQPVFKDLLAVE